MKIEGRDLQARQQAIAMVDTETGEFTEKTLSHEANAVREFYVALGGRVVVGIEAIGAMQLSHPVLTKPVFVRGGLLSTCYSAVVRGGPSPLKKKTGSGNLMSDLLFTSKYPRDLIQIGCFDASERIDEIEDFLYSSREGDAEEPSASETGGNVPKAGAAAKRTGNSVGSRG